MLILFLSHKFSSAFSVRDHLYFSPFWQLENTSWWYCVLFAVLLWSTNFYFSLSVSFSVSISDIDWNWWSDPRVAFSYKTASWLLLLNTGTGMWVDWNWAISYQIYASSCSKVTGILESIIFLSMEHLMWQIVPAGMIIRSFGDLAGLMLDSFWDCSN